MMLLGRHAGSATIDSFPCVFEHMVLASLRQRETK